MIRWSLWRRLQDSYDHYRYYVGLSRPVALYRTLYFEIHLREP